MEANRQNFFYEFCPVKYVFVLKKVLNRKDFLRVFDFRVRFNDKVEFIIYERKHPLEYICPIIKFNHTPI